MPKFIADLHIHSKYSRATSPLLTPEHLEYWAKIKGIQVMGTGDCIHPGWLNELETKLEPSDNGLYILKKEFQLPETKNLSNTLQKKPVYFIPTTEISNIYKKGLKTRKVHNICIMPNFDIVRAFQSKIDKIGNIHSDGRPILGLDSKLLLELLLDSGELTYLIPAHIWTPWFSVLGSNSGFDNIEECYEDLSSEIFALETGLSSDPPMNRICSFLDKYRLISNSDAHSPDKLGREANIFDTDISYKHIYNSLKNDEGFVGTIEFFPEEGKYHNDGHRNCNINWTPLETVEHSGICPVCGKPVTKGVLHRVSELADRSNPNEANSKQTFWSITPLAGLIAEIEQKKNERSKTIVDKYFQLTNNLGSEFEILLNTNLDDIKNIAGEITAEGIKRLRKGLVSAQGGYDGEFGKISVFNPSEIKHFRTESLFSQNNISNNISSYSSLTFDVQKFKEKLKSLPTVATSENPKNNWINAGQEDAINHKDGPCVVLAGPGAGKTKVLSERVAKLISNGISPENILAVTFSNKASQEMQERIANIMGNNNCVITTFHKLGLNILREEMNLHNNENLFGIIDQNKQIEILKKIFDSDYNLILNKIEIIKQSRVSTTNTEENFTELYKAELNKINAIDINDLIYLTVKMLLKNKETLIKYQQRHQWILVDEFQDINAIQYQFLELLSNKQNIFVIGDPDQAIYGFRGAKTELLENFPTDYPNTKLIKLQKSYRCPTNILKSASMVINKTNSMSSDNLGDILDLKEFSSAGAEAEWIASEIERILGGVSNFSYNSKIVTDTASKNNVSLKDIAILCRTKHLFPDISKALNDHRLPYQIVNTSSVFQTEPYLGIITTLKTIYFGFEKQFSKNNKDIVSMFEKGIDLALILRTLCLEYNITAEQQRILERTTKPYKNDYLKFFDDISLKTGNDEYDGKIEKITLMTIHASKGLEFKYVFIPGCENKIIPFQIFEKRTKEELKEESRILYVAMTRAKEKLFLTYANKRKILNKLLTNSISPFVKKITDDLLNKEKIEITTKSSLNQLSLF